MYMENSAWECDKAEMWQAEMSRPFSSKIGHSSIHLFSSSRHVSSLRVRYTQSWYQTVACLYDFALAFCVPVVCNIMICAEQRDRVELWHAHEFSQLSSSSQLCVLKAFSWDFTNATDSIDKAATWWTYQWFLSTSDAECLHRCLSSYTYYYGVLLSLSGFNDAKQKFGKLHMTHGTLS